MVEVAHRASSREGHILSQLNVRNQTKTEYFRTVARLNEPRKRHES
jgi:hypothetical protein